MELMKVFACITFLLWCVTATGLFAQEAKPAEVPVTGAATPQKPVEERVTGSVTLGVFNKYIFRGYKLSTGGFVVQPAISASVKGFSATYWGNVDGDAHDTQSYFPSAYNKKGKKWFNETDLTVGYTHAFDKLSLTGGYIYYNTKYTDETEEFFLSAAYDILTKPTLIINQDITSYTGTYMNLSLSHSVPLYKETTLDLGASGGYFIGKNRYWRTYEASTGAYTGSKYKGFHDGMVKVGLTIPLAKAVSFQPVAQYWFPLSGDARRKVGTASYNPNGYLGTVFVGGANFTYSF
jgi:hypothetical protein